MSLIQLLNYRNLPQKLLKDSYPELYHQIESYNDIILIDNDKTYIFDISYIHDSTFYESESRICMDSTVYDNDTTKKVLYFNISKDCFAIDYYSNDYLLTETNYYTLIGNKLIPHHPSE